eukprot:6212375-Pleurochrysis_carterae.AAC.2
MMREVLSIGSEKFRTWKQSSPISLDSAACASARGFANLYLYLLVSKYLGTPLPRPRRRPRAMDVAKTAAHISGIRARARREGTAFRSGVRPL